MRALMVFGVVTLCAPAFGAAAADDDDPKLARGDQHPPPPLALPDEDDPKLARSASGSVRRRPFRNTHDVPRVKLAYRHLTVAGLDSDTIDFNVAELDYYPSSGYLRFGIDTELGLGQDKYSSWFFTAGAALGVQYPARVTPFLEGRFVAGLIGGSFLGQSAVSWVYMGGLDTGIELYVAGRFYFTAAIGWVHPIYSGIDTAYVRAHPMLNPERKELSYDSFTFKLGLGL